MAILLEDKSLTRAYGFLWQNTPNSSLTLSVADTFEKITLFDTNGDSLNTTVDQNQSSIVVDIAGEYYITVQFSFDGTLADQYVAEIRNNDVVIPGSKVTVINSADDTQSFTCSCIDGLASGDEIEFWAKFVSGTGDFHTKHMNMSVIKL